MKMKNELIVRSQGKGFLSRDMLLKDSITQQFKSLLKKKLFVYFKSDKSNIYTSLQ